MGHERPWGSERLAYPQPMNRDTLRALARCRRALLALHALPPGSLPDELEDLVEDLIAPGFRERLLALYLASLPPSGQVQ